MSEGIEKSLRVIHRAVTSGDRPAGENVTSLKKPPSKAELRDAVDSIQAAVRERENK